MRTITLLIAVFFILSCSSNGDNKRYKIYDEYIITNNLEEKNRVNGFFFRGWNSLDNRHLILNSSHNKSYLLTLAFYCNDLDFSTGIILDQTNNTSLSSKFDSIIVPPQSSQDISQKCRISTIHKINKQQRDELTGLRKKSNKSSN